MEDFLNRRHRKTWAPQHDLAGNFANFSSAIRPAMATSGLFDSDYDDAVQDTFVAGQARWNQICHQILFPCTI